MEIYDQKNGGDQTEMDNIKIDRIGVFNNKSGENCQTCLKVVRERGLSDTVVTMLQNWCLNFVDDVLLTSAVSHRHSTTASCESLCSKSNPNLLKPTALSNFRTSQNDDKFLFDENYDQASSTKMISERKRSNSEPHKPAADLPDLMTSLNLDNQSSSLRYNDQKCCGTTALQQFDSAIDLNRKNRRSSISSICGIKKSSSYLTENCEIDEFGQSSLSNSAENQKDEYQ
uniref:Uncharacterized protein n=1 Tax=Romanomermis culicivorax TaxID=13658 RepID=A0A915J5M1_ROMCU